MAFIVKPYRKLRDILKVDLISSRGIYSLGNTRRPKCPVCDCVIKDFPDMHEALISKGQVNGHQNQDAINSRYNCVLRHQFCPNGLGYHSGGIGGNELFEKCARHIVEWEGRLETRKWLAAMEVVFSTVGRDALRRFDSIDWSKDITHADRS